MLRSITATEQANELLDLACLHYGVAPGAPSVSGYPESPARRKRAARILERHPEVARHSIHTPVVCGDLKAMELAGGPGFYRELGLERLFRDMQGAPYHALPEKKQQVFSGRLAFGMEPV